MRRTGIAGIGFRDRAGLASVLDALDRAGAAGVRRLALPARKAGHPLAEALARRGHDLTWVSDAALAGAETPTDSPVCRAVYGTGSVAEACALSAARALGGPGARLIGPRALSADRMATAALALTGDHE